MFAGFSSATGKLAGSHYILGWTVCSATTLVLLVIVVFISLYYLQRLKYKDVLEEWELQCSHRFPYRDLFKATKGFKDSEILGSGGFGCVYKGVLPATQEEVAVKKISHNSRQGIREFIMEIASLGRMRHKHLVHLHGWCKHKDELLLVYDFMPNGSLGDILFNHKKSGILSWEQRFSILKGVASALLYLHEEWEQVVVHRDVKANNVLLDADMNARLGDFGLARLYDHGEEACTTHIVGTLGYIAPELSRTGKATTHCDMFSYGALLLEVACGRPPIDPNASSKWVLLLDWVRECWAAGCIVEAADPKLDNEYAVEEMELASTYSTYSIVGNSVALYHPPSNLKNAYSDNTQFIFQGFKGTSTANLSLNGASIITSTDPESGGGHGFAFTDTMYVGFSSATGKLADSHYILGWRGFGCVYKGVLPTTKEEIAVKKISHNSRQGIKEFIMEIASLGRMKHKHLERPQLIVMCFHMAHCS
ncbi:unnamed protein product, partial [Vitis vinifera]|uniref:non-specific serine/threonine protein kinase n=1 Tax=Vitis vinifera TaxID=29760 RepID=D7SQV0_VITVI